MRRFGVALAGALLSAGPVCAQDIYEPAFTPEDDLDCALYIGALLAEMEESMTPDNRTGLTSAFTYFIGRYEAQRGLDVATALAERYSDYQARNSAEIAQTCASRMRSFGNRLQNVQNAISNAEGEAPADPAEQPRE